MTAGAGGVSDASPLGGGFGFYVGDISAIRSYGINLPATYGPDFSFLSVGDRVYAFLSESGQLPDVVPVGFYQDVEEASLPPEIDRRDQPPDQENVVRIAIDWVEYWALKAQGIAVAQPLPLADRGIFNPAVDIISEDFKPVGTSAGEPGTLVQSGETDVGWIEDLYGAADVIAGGWLPGGPVSPWDNTSIVTWGQGPGGGAPPPVIINQPPIGPPPPQGGLPMACGDNDPMKGMVWKRVCGQYKWVKQRRRRRRKLVSQSDAAGLSTLVSILGNGKNTQAWIATHSS